MSLDQLDAFLAHARADAALDHRLHDPLDPPDLAAFLALAGWLACYPALMDACWLDGERVIPQPGGFYGGWITSTVEGPFKGDPRHPELI
jgi:Nif11 domain